MPRSNKEVFDAAQQFDMTRVVERYARDNSIPIEIAREHERELKRYLALVALNPKKPLGMRGQVDELWHTFLFFSRDYFDFCKKVAGKYIHHVPETGDAPVSLDDYAEMLKLYAAEFGEEPPSHVWPSLRIGDGPSGAICSTSCSGCGSCSSCGSGCSGCSACSASGAG